VTLGSFVEAFLQALAAGLFIGCIYGLMWQKGQPVTVYPPRSASAEPIWVAKR
jgi:hypothetical protein